MQTVYLEGPISKFGKEFKVSCNTTRDIFKLLDCQLEGFRQHLINGVDLGIGYTIQKGDRFLESEEELFLSLNPEDIIITEVPAGASSGLGKIFAAIAMVALLVIAPYAAPGLFGAFGSMPLISVGATGISLTTGGLVIAGLAINLALTGVMQLIAPGPEVDTGSEQNEAYLFDGPTNTVKQGVAIPVSYGELLVGGAGMSIGFQTKPIRPNPSYNYGTTLTWPLTSTSTSPSGEAYYAATLPTVTFAEGDTGVNWDNVDKTMACRIIGPSSVDNHTVMSIYYSNSDYVSVVVGPDYQIFFRDATSGIASDTQTGVYANTGVHRKILFEIKNDPKEWRLRILDVGTDLLYDSDWSSYQQALGDLGTANVIFKCRSLTATWVYHGTATDGYVYNSILTDQQTSNLVYDI